MRVQYKAVQDCEEYTDKFNRKWRDMPISILFSWKRETGEQTCTTSIELLTQGGNTNFNQAVS